MSPRKLQIYGGIVVIISVVVIWIPLFSHLLSETPDITFTWIAMILGVVVDATGLASLIFPERALSKYGRYPQTLIDPLLVELGEIISDIERVKKNLKQLHITKTDVFFGRPSIEKEIRSNVEKLHIHIEDLKEIKGRLDTELSYYENIPNRSEVDESSG